MNGILVKSLEGIVGTENVSTSEAVCEAYSRTAESQDLLHRRPDIVVLPTTPEQVSSILSLANKHRIAVCPRGQATGFNGENIPLEGGIMLDMSLMNKVLEVDEDNMVVIAEGGCTIHQIDEELEKRNLSLALTPFMVVNMQVGAWFANNGIGEFGSVAGRVGDQVRGVEVVLPTGEIVKVGSWAYEFGYGAFSKYAGGPDLVGMFCGSAGTLGVFTKVALRVIDKPKYTWYGTFAWRQDKFKEIARGLYELQRYGVSSFELRDYWALEFIGAVGVIKLPEEAKLGYPKEEVVLAIVLQNASSKEELKIKEKNTIRILEENGGLSLGPEIAKAGKGPPYYAWSLILTCRLYPFMPHPERCTIIMDFIATLPTLKLPEYWDYFKSVLKKHGFTGGQRGGILRVAPLNSVSLIPFPAFAYRADIPEEAARMKEAYEEIQQGFARMGVVPYTLGAFIPRSYLNNLGPAHDLMRSIKKQLDPNNILNPGIY